jgi:hypothetical protein
MQTESNLFDPIDECITDVGDLAKDIKNTYSIKFNRITFRSCRNVFG